jgi:hypothetical protein
LRNPMACSTNCSTATANKWYTRRILTESHYETCEYSDRSYDNCAEYRNAGEAHFGKRLEFVDASEIVANGDEGEEERLGHEPVEGAG